VLKPSERDPSASLILANLLKEAGLPDGVFNVVNGDKEAVDALLEHPDVSAVSFVGSTPTAEYIYGQGTRRGKLGSRMGPYLFIGPCRRRFVPGAFGVAPCELASTGRRVFASHYLVGSWVVGYDLPTGGFTGRQ
jgi:hypothetical protein